MMGPNGLDQYFIAQLLKEEIKVFLTP